MDIIDEITENPGSNEANIYFIVFPYLPHY
jgi:hypothetical protein